jgi:hypothetical protein
MSAARLVASRCTETTTLGPDKIAGFPTKREILHMKLRHVAAIGAATVALSVGPMTGTAHADPPPAPSPVPSWVGEEARALMADALQCDGYDPVHANDLAKWALGHYLP